MTKIYTIHGKILDNIYEFLRQHMTYFVVATYGNILYNI